MVSSGGRANCELISTTGQIVKVNTFACHNPSLKIRLFSPQTSFNTTATRGGKFVITHDMCHLHFRNNMVVQFPVDTNSFMPMAPSFHDAAKTAKMLANPNSVVSSDIQNLTTLQKLLLKCHCKMGHLGFQHLKWLGLCGCFSTNG